MKTRRILLEKTQRFLRGWRDWHINVKSRWRPGAFYMRKHNDFSGVGGSGISIYSQDDEDQAHFTWENATISPGLAGVAYKFTVKMKPGRILHEKTQRFLRGWQECTRTFHVNLQSKWSPGAFYTRKHNDFSAVGGTRTYISRKFTVEMKPRRILHEKTQRFLCSWRDAHVHFT